MRFTEYNKMQVQIRFVVIKAQHGVSARKSVETHHTSKEGRLTGIVSVTLQYS